jgi:ferredoxin
MPPPRACTVHLARRGLVLAVPPQQSLLEALQCAGVDVPHGCLEGLCGLCETRVTVGEPEHRDRVYANRRHPPRDRLVVCVSRSRGESITLDL